MTHVTFLTKHVSWTKREIVIHHQTVLSIDETGRKKQLFVEIEHQCLLFKAQEFFITGESDKGITNLNKTNGLFRTKRLLTKQKLKYIISNRNTGEQISNSCQSQTPN